MSIPKYNVGDQVLIINPNEYGGKCYLKRGEILKLFKKLGRYLYGVKIDDLPNPRSSNGVYWFGVRSIEAVANDVVESEEILCLKTLLWLV